MTCDAIAGDIEARRFNGLPEGINKPVALMATLKRAKVQLGIPGEVVELLDCLFSFTKPQDWQADARPIVWPSNSLLAHQLGLTRSGLKKRIRQAIERRLLSEKPSSNGERFGVRYRGVIDRDASFGFDLALMAIRHAEFAAAADEGQQLYKATKAVQWRGYTAKTALLQLIETAAQRALWTNYWDVLEARCAELYRALADTDRLDQLAHATDRLEHLRSEAETVLMTALGNRAPAAAYSGDSNLMRSPEGPLYNSTNQLPESGGTCRDARQDGCREDRNGPPSRLAVATDVKEKFAASVVLEAAPETAMYCQDARPSWEDLAESARLLCPHYEISQRLWGRACQALGRHEAALALAVMIHQTGRRRVAIPGGYFHNMIARAERGELDLRRSYYGMRARQTQNVRQRRQ